MEIKVEGRHVGRAGRLGRLNRRAPTCTVRVGVDDDGEGCRQGHYSTTSTLRALARVLAFFLLYKIVYFFLKNKSFKVYVYTS